MSCLTRLRRVALAALLPFGLIGKVSAGTDLPIYTDALQNGFQDWSWARRSLSNQAPVHSGLYSIRVDAVAWTGLFLHHPPLDTSSYTNVSLWVNGGRAGGQLLRVVAKLGTNEVGQYLLPALPPSPPSKWQKFVIPLALLGADNKTNFEGFLIQLRNDCPTNSFYLDDIMLGAKAGAPTPEVIGDGAAPTPPPTRIAQSDPTVWLLAGLGLLIFALILIWYAFSTRRMGNPGPASAAAQSQAGPADPAPDSPKGTGVEEWRQRAIIAETVASKQAQILRESLAPTLSDKTKGIAVKGTTAQRNSPIETQRLAELELARLEERLSELRLPARDRIRAYETRISDLENELLNRGEEMRELVQATLSLVRHRMEEEKKKGFVDDKAN